MIRSRHNYHLRVGLFFCALLVYVNALAQTSPPAVSTPGPVLKVEVRVVLVDVVVTEKKGQSVPGLRRQEFQILEDGKPQAISYFEEHTVNPSPPSKAPPPPPNVYTNSQFVVAPDSVNVLLLDWLNTQPQDRQFAQRQIADYIHRMPAGASMAAFVLGSHLQMVADFSSHSSDLLAMLEKQKSGASRQSSSLLASNSMNAAESQMVDMMHTMQAAQAAIDGVQEEQAVNNAKMISERVGITLQAMQELARFLSGLPGRKNVIWFSSAFPINLFPNHGDVPHQFGQALKKTANLLAESRVSIYPVSASGLSQGFSIDMRSQNPGLAGMDQVSNQNAMDALAKDTGGRAFYNTNGIADSLAHAVDVGSHYYTLTYTPFNPFIDGKFRKIEVKVGHHAYKVAYRRGYYASDAKADAADTHSSNDALARLVRFGMPDIAQIPYTVLVKTINLPPSPGDGALSPNNPVRRYLLDFSIPLTGLSVNYSPDGAYHDSLSMLVAAYDFEGKLLNVNKHNVDVTLQLDDYARARQQGLQLHGEIDAPRGNVYLRTGISDLNSSNTGTLAIPMSESAQDVAMRPQPAASSSAESAPLTPVKIPSITPERAIESAGSNPAPLTSDDDITVIPLEPRDLADAPVVGPPCKIEEVLPKLSKQASEFVEDMNHFTATELVELERLDRHGKAHVLGRTQSNYVVAIESLHEGSYTVSEYRKATQGAGHFASGLTADGTPALALIFHSSNLEAFDMSCGSLVNLHGHDAWEIHFRQRKDRPATIATFTEGHQEHPMLLSGTAWVDSSNYHLVHLNADLLQPISEAKLTLLHQSIDYGAVPFGARHITLWLPKAADVTAEFNGQRLRERRSYKDFTLFAVETGERIAAPKQTAQ